MIPPAFLAPANRLTYYLAIPAMIFRAIAKSDFFAQFDIWLLAGTLLPILIVYLIFWLVCLISGVSVSLRGTLIDTSIHGNIGYIGLAIVFYYLGADALATAGILAGFVMLMHNSLGVVALQVYAGNTGKQRGIRQLLVKIIGNPIIATALISIGFSLSGLHTPIIIDRTLAIIGNLALPMALLLIGASLSFHIQSRKLVLIIAVSMVKLFLLPAVGFLFYNLFDLHHATYLPGLILLSAPVATVTYILASELEGDPSLAVSLISISTALSALSITFWLSIV